MKKTRSGLFALTILVLMSGCGSSKILSDKDSTVDFSKFKTFEYYGWAEHSDKLLSPFDKERIEEAFGRELAKRGLKGVQKSAGGDLLITLYIVTVDKTRTTANTTSMGMGMSMGYGGYGYGYRYGGYGPGYGWGGGTSHTTYSEHDYTVGTLIIDVYDAKEKKLIWEASITDTINEKTRGREARIDKVVMYMMKEYPVKPKK